MPNVKDRELAVKLLKENLPKCNVQFIEGELPEDEIKKF